jgi:uncharacterized protein with PIN domain
MKRKGIKRKSDAIRIALREVAARATPNMGDCFAYALAKEEDCPSHTVDRDFKNTDISVVLPK